MDLGFPHRARLTHPVDAQEPPQPSSPHCRFVQSEAQMHAPSWQRSRSAQRPQRTPQARSGPQESPVQSRVAGQPAGGASQ